MQPIFRSPACPAPIKLLLYKEYWKQESLQLVQFLMSAFPVPEIMALVVMDIHVFNT